MEGFAEAVRDVFARYVWAEHVPAISWGVVRDGALADAGGLGTLRLDAEEIPDADSVFRIASMTKSFTGAAVVLLRDEGLLRLDEPVATYVPELASWRGPTADSPPITLRHLLSMESGLPYDDPWADRHLDLSAEGLDALIARGATLAWAPGTRFEYASLGWGLVGRVVERVAGAPVQRVISERLLAPLGMSSTSWTRPEGARVAEGYRWDDGAWSPELPPPGDGAIAPMGGLWTTVTDLARWVRYLMDAFPPRDDPDDGPLSRASRRELQQLRRDATIESVRPRRAGAARTVATGYGIGLFVRLDPRLGTIVAHSGGLPGYGSHMRMLPERGLAVIALGNVTYAPMAAAVTEALDVLADLDALPPARKVQPSPALVEAAGRLTALLQAWDEDEAAALFADNVAPDLAFERRREQAAELRDRHGDLAFDGTIEADAPLSGTLALAGGKVKVELALTGHVPALVQWYEVTDRTRAPETPVIVDAAFLREVAGSAVAVLRPCGDVLDLFGELQGRLLDRFPEVAWSVPAAHCSLKGFGSSAAPLRLEDEAAAAEAVASWAALTERPTLHAEAVGVFDTPDEGRIVYVRVGASAALRAALATVRARTAGLPASGSDVVATEDWIFHLSLAYAEAVDDALWAEIVAWASRTTVDASCACECVDLLAYDGGPERVLGRFPLGRVALGGE
ncbi:MAG: serine hydrolase domain-containing protein [Planctomycetaceae bacterium]